MDRQKFEATLFCSCSRHGSHRARMSSTDITAWICCANQQEILLRNGKHPLASFYLDGELQTADQVAEIASEHLLEHLVTDDGTMPF